MNNCLYKYSSGQNNVWLTCNERATMTAVLFRGCLSHVSQLFLLSDTPHGVNCWSFFCQLSVKIWSKQEAVYNHWTGLTGLDWWTGTVDSVKFSTHICYGQRVGGRTRSLTSRSKEYYYELQEQRVWWAQVIFDQALQPRALGFFKSCT